ncbi:DODA-type extradiol aromatic ring-opening family dioxygenase [Simiduia agarivorans]|uniref:Extradiol ring-cleavage dioxygenase class III protein subunit B n=1 Tax=Simiduia agarivorans (strain DSM 21679 / JCM 13881 / BCRC 17597 / SA1) TaxID=1117647 RepID=K4KQJ7_SIMAS|nr:class III extradiol ring-cleavage dioxygenase [Simiduia agarivorans]AFV00394.1 extradiol ring-cleavage dioxygenase class III protein subunit B [Simiduia agarivorans SA1 = DSM 21679]
MSQVVFVSHGGGPLPLLGDPGHAELVDSFSEMRRALPKAPSLIVVISAHWEASAFSLLATPEPGLLYDYSGFDRAAYELNYPASGVPEMAGDWAQRLNARGWQIGLESNRGWDHGVFVPLLLLFPDAQVPVLQVSLQRGLDVARHWLFAEALATLLPDDALVLGSGFSFHNMPGFFAEKTPAFHAQVADFTQWLDRSVQVPDSRQRWLQWSDAPGARFSHPREEHLMPLIMCAAIAKRPGNAYATHVMDVEARHYVW